MTADQDHPRRGRGSAGPDLFESKLHPPNAHTTLVPRKELVDRLVETRDVPIASVIAPPGYGKTTLLAQWARRDPAHFAWLSLDRHDNDIGRLESYASAALDRVQPGDPARLKRSTRRRSVAATASRLAGLMAEMSDPVTLVFDNVEQLDDGECLDAVAELALHLPTGARLALATRRELPLPMPRLRAAGDVLEIGVDDLAMNQSDARALLEAAGAEMPEADIEKVIDRAEGWPVGLYLAALALKAGGPRERAGIPFSGDDRLIAEYLRSEILDRLTADHVTFLTRTSVLDRMTGSLCDAVLDATGSADELDALARSNLLLVALDRTGEWFRYHHLFHDLLHTELQRREPDLLPMLHTRAADWYEAHGLPEFAIDHAQTAGDADRVSNLVLLNAAPAYAEGRIQSVERWFAWFDERGLAEQYPGLAVTGAVIFSATGRTSETERWAAAAESAAAEPGHLDRPLIDGTTLESWLASLRLSLCRDGLDGMRRDVEIAMLGLAPRSGYRAAVLVFEAISYLFDGAVDRADAILAHALDVAADTGRPPAALVASATRGFIASGRNDWSSAGVFAAQSLNLIETWSLYDNAESALAYALAARTAHHAHDTEAADEYMVRSARLRPILNAARPLGSLHALVELARNYVDLDDAAGAREVIRQAREILRQRPNLGSLADQVDALEARIETMQTGRIGASSLTAAELRLVPLLPTHLTYPQIAERLQISRHTSKAQAMSMYQKLGVSSRSEAVERLTALGLLEI